MDVALDRLVVELEERMRVVNDIGDAAAEVRTAASWSESAGGRVDLRSWWAHHGGRLGASKTE
jgi:hypothetical protein